MLESALAASGTDAQSRIEALLNAMTLDQKISQMIMPALRTWDSEKVTELSGNSALAEALRRHQYGGVILFGQNISGTEQTLRLIDDLQRNNALGAFDAIPYLISADQEGGSVARLTMGTRGTGSMAIGATGEAAEGNARSIGQVFGEELEALGINVNLGPCIDVIADLSDLGMSTRVFSDDPEVVARLGLAFAEGVGQSNVVTCFKHFPGAGDGSDYPTSIWLTPEQLDARLLRDFASSGKKQLQTELNSLLPSRLADLFPRLCGLPDTLACSQITGEQRRRLGEMLKVLPLTVRAPLNPGTMESKSVGGLYFAGEVIDVDAHTGGYNLQIAWSTGALSGASAAEDTLSSL